MDIQHYFNWFKNIQEIKEECKKSFSILSINEKIHILFDLNSGDLRNTCSFFEFVLGNSCYTLNGNLHNVECELDLLKYHNYSLIYFADNLTEQDVLDYMENRRHHYQSNDFDSITYDDANIELFIALLEQNFYSFTYDW